MFHARPSASGRPAAIRGSIARSALLIALCVFILCGVILVFINLLTSHRSDQERLEADTGPLLLSIQRIGQLHTVTFNMKDVLRQVSEQDPSGWVSDLPGADNVVHWATRNEAVVAVEGSVEAGIDLSHITAKDITQVRRPDGSTVMHVHLPPVTVYPAVVHLRVINDRSGPFFRDEQILPKAQARAEQVFRVQAEQGGIAANARTNAIQTLQGIENALGHKNIEFAF